MTVPRRKPKILQSTSQKEKNNIMQQGWREWTNPPRKAPTGLRVGNACSVRRGDDVENENENARGGSGEVARARPARRGRVRCSIVSKILEVVVFIFFERVIGYWVLACSSWSVCSLEWMMEASLRLSASLGSGSR